MDYVSDITPHILNMGDTHMKKIISSMAITLGLVSTGIAAPQWYMTCHIEERKNLEVKKYKLDSLPMSSIRQSAQLIGGLDFEAYREVKTKADPLTPWIKLGDQQVIINVSYKSYPISNVLGKDDALSITRLNGVALVIACFTFKK